MTVFLENILNEIYSKVQQSIHGTEAGLLEIVGEPGIGKTVLLGQVEEFLRLSGLNFQHIAINITSSQSINESLLEYARESGLLTPAIENNQFSETGGLYNLLSVLRKPNRDSLVICIDDAHLLYEDSIKTIRKVFNPLFTEDSFFCILVGRPGWQNKKAITMTGFSKNEGKQYLENRVNADWEPLYARQLDWILKTANSNPQHLSLLVDHLKENNLLTDSGYIASLDEMMQLPISNDLYDQISYKFDINSLSNQKRNLLSILSLAKDHRLKVDKINLLFPGTKSIDEDISALIKTGWLIQSDDYFNFSHSLIMQIVQESISPKQKEMWTRQILKSLKAKGDERSHYLSNISNLNKNEIKKLYSWALKLSSNAQFQSALNIWKKLYKQSADPKTLHNIARMHYELRQFNEAITSFELVISSSKYAIDPAPYYYMASIYQMKREYDSAQKYYDEMEKFLKSDHDNYFKMTRSLILYHQQAGNEEEFLTRFEKFKQEYENSSKYKLEYIDLVCILYDRLDLGVDIEKIANDGIRIARKRKLPEKIRNFYKTLINYHEKRGEITQAYELVKQIDRDSSIDYIIENDAQELVMKARIYYYVGHYKKAMGFYKQAAAIYETMGLDVFQLDCIQSICTIEGLIGNISAMKKGLMIIETGIKGKLISDVMIIRYTIASIYNFIGNHGEAKQEFEELYLYIKTTNDHQMIAHIRISLANVLYSYNKEKAWKYWEKAHSYFIKNKLLSTLSVQYFNMGWTLIINNEPPRLKQLLNTWKKHVEKAQDTFHYQYIHAGFDIMSGNISSGLTRVSLLEEKIDGSFMWEWKKLYEWLSNHNLKSQLKSKYAYRSAVVNSFCTNQSVIQDIPKLKEFSSLDRFLEGWRNAITTNHILDSNLLEDFIEDFDRQEEFKNTLELWGIKCVDFSTISSSSNGKPVVINLLGKPELYINNRQLTSKDWTSKKALEVLLYVLIKSWRHKNAVDKNELLHDLWSPTSDRIEARRLARNNMLSRVRNIFTECESQMLSTKDNDIIFDWDSGNYHLDIEVFVKNIAFAKSLLKKNKLNLAKQKFNIALSLYRGDFCEGFDGLFLESDRAYFNELKLESEAFLKTI